METECAEDATVSQELPAPGSSMDIAMEQGMPGECGEEEEIDAGSPGDALESDEEEDPGEAHEFEIIDQVDSEEEEKEGDATGEGEHANQEGHAGAGNRDGGGPHGSSDYSSEEDDVDDTEVHAMLEQGVDRNSIKKREVPSDGKPIIKLKTVLKEFETDPFDILPEGWIYVTHYCGMPVYLHRESRVCTMSRPYTLGSASARTHNIPISAIPCLLYRKQLDKFAQQQNNESPESSATVAVAEVDESRSQGEKLVCQASQDLLPGGPLESTACPVSSSAIASSSAVQNLEPRPVLVMEESTCQGGSHKAAHPNEVLHMGQEGFSSWVSQESSLRNIALDKNEAVKSESASVSKGVEENENLAVAGGRAVATSENDCYMTTSSPSGIGDSIPAESLSNSTRIGVPTEESCVSDQVPQVRLSAAVPCEESGGQENLADSPEEGEIVEDNSSSEKENTSLKSRCPVLSQKDTSSPLDTVANGELDGHCSRQHVAQSEEEKVSGDASSQVTRNGEKPICESHVVREEEGGSNSSNNNNQQSCHVVREEEGNAEQQPSELVTSNSNSLATLKRKIDLLRNRHGGKLRRLENGNRGVSASAAGWPVENNVAMSSLQFGDASPAMKANCNETLKANAAAIKIKSAEERAKESLLDSQTVQNYCSKLFQFKVIEVKKYSTWRERRRHLEQKYKRNRPELPSATKLITCPMPSGKAGTGGNWSNKREYVLNPSGKSFLGILHEYMQRSLRLQPVYVFKELENSKTPYGATVTINNIEYGTGYASSKKIAKQEAAKETLKILMPDLFNKMSAQEIKHSISDLSFFDNVKVTDTRVLELGKKVGQPSPFEILQECLRRNFGMGNTQCEISTKPKKNQKCEYSIKVGKHSANVVAKNKRDGKQLASQAILSKLHPHIPSWGSLLRLYGSTVEKPIQKPEQMAEVKGHAPNLSVLASLREQMKKLHQRKEAIQVKGKILISSKDLPNKTVGVDF